MINVDVVGQLFPSLPTVVVQLASTLVLFLAARFLLYRPIMDFLNARQAEADHQLADARLKNDQARHDRDLAKNTLQESKAEATRLIEQAKAQANMQSASILNEAKVVANRTKMDADQWANQRKAKIMDEVKDEMVDIALAASKRLIQDKVDETIDHQMVDDFIKEYSDHE